MQTVSLIGNLRVLRVSRYDQFHEDAHYRIPVRQSSEEGLTLRAKRSATPVISPKDTLHGYPVRLRPDS
jgi:hypothetical protein